MITVSKLNEMSKNVYAFNVRKGDLVKTVWGYEEVTAVDVETWETKSVTGRTVKACKTTIYTNGKLGKETYKMAEAVIIVRAEDVKAEAEVGTTDINLEVSDELSIFDVVDAIADDVAPIEILKRSVTKEGIIITSINNLDGVKSTEKIATYKIENTRGDVQVLQEYNTKLEAIVSHDHHVKDPINDPGDPTDPIAEAVAIQMRYLDIKTELKNSGSTIIHAYKNKRSIFIVRNYIKDQDNYVYAILTVPMGSNKPFEKKIVHYNTMAEVLVALGSIDGIISNL